MSVLPEISFAALLGRYVGQRGYSYGQLARLSGLPKRTIAHWLEGIVARPRDWRDLLRLAAALHLDEADTTRLLQAAGHAGLAHLLAQVEGEADGALLAPWAEGLRRQWEHSPFQAVADLPHFVGRQRQMEAIQQTLLGPQAIKICSLQGMAGAGKTALATRLAYRLRPFFPDGVLWARLDNTDSLSILNSFARAYGVEVGDYTDLESRSRAVRELLAHKRALLVLDNVESSDQVQPLLPPSGPCAVILTTRRHDLAVARGAQRFQLGPFEQRQDSLALFAKILGAEMAGRQQAALDEIATLLGDLPLALDLAASRLAHEPGWSAGEFLERLRGEGSRLGELVYENQSIRLSFGLSQRCLSPEQQRVFHCLGLFAGQDFGVDAAASVTGLAPAGMADHLRSFYALSLAQLGRPGRYRLHPLLRDLALEAPAAPQARRRLVDFFIAYAEAQRENPPALELESGNLFAALQAAFELSMDAELVRGVLALCHFLDVRGDYPAIELHGGRALQGAEALGDRAGLACLHYHLGLALIHAGRLPAAERHLRAGLEQARLAAGLDEVAALLLGHLALTAYLHNADREMELYLQEALALAGVAHQDGTLCRLLDGLNGIAQQRGDYATAETCCRQGLALARQTEDAELVSTLLKSLGSVLAERGGAYGEVCACLDEGLALARESGHRRLVCASLCAWGYAACGYGEYEQAQRCAREALTLAISAGLPVEQAYALCTLGLACLGRGEYARAGAHLSEGLAFVRQVGLQVLEAPVLNAWGWLHLKQQAAGPAERAFGEAQEIARRGDNRYERANALYGLANIAAAQGELETARRLAGESLATLEAIGHRTRLEVRAWLEQLR